MSLISLQLHSERRVRKVYCINIVYEGNKLRTLPEESSITIIENR